MKGNLSGQHFVIIAMFLGIVLSFMMSASIAGNPLLQLNGKHFKIYYSQDAASRAKNIGKHVENALVYTSKLVGFKPEISVYILNPEDWPLHTTFPVYGMPHYNEKSRRLIIASEDNDFWKSFIPPVDELPSTLEEEVRKAYTVNGSLSMQPFFDLLAIHELGHAFHDQGGITMHRKWMGELFVNILLHTYIAEKEPELLPALITFPRMVINGGKAQYKFTSLVDIEKRYDEIGEKYPVNYGWYQSRWHAAAHDIYNAGGTSAFIKLWTALKNHKEPMDDEAFALFLQQKTHPSIADVWYKWND